MSVPVGKRKIAELEFYHTALKMRTEITKWLLRDFGLKAKTRDLAFYSKKNKISDEDREVLCGIMEKYSLGDRLLESFPEWWIDNRRNIVDKHLADLASYIVKANSIYPVCEQEYYERRLLIDRAISCVYSLIEELQFVLSVLFKADGADVQKYMPFIEMAEKELALLRGWRKSDNKILVRIKKSNKD